MTQGGFEFWIDGVLYKDALNWNEFKESIEFDDQLKVFIFKYENKLRFAGDVYAYLYGKRNTGGMCYVADITIKRTCSGGTPSQVMKGKIFVADCLFFINQCVVECSVHDDNFSSLLFNNKGIKVQMEQFWSKNHVIGNDTTVGLGLTYLNTTTTQMKQQINYFNPATGALVGGQDTAIYYLHDVFNYLVGFLTDGQCGFRSNYLDWTLPIVNEIDKVKQLVIASGYNIRVYGLNEQIPLSLTFEQLFKEVNRLYPIILYVEYDSTGKPIIVIEDEDSVRQEANLLTLNNLSDVKEKSDNALLYGTIRIGSPSTPYISSIHSYTPAPNISFGEESIYLNGYCNTSTEKDLFGEFICDSNIIQELTLTNTSNTAYDSNIFFIEVDPASVTFGGIYNAIKSLNYDDITKYHYNDSLLNINVVARNNFHNNVSNSVGLGGVYLSNYSTGVTSAVALGSHYNCPAFGYVPPQTSAYSVLNFIVDNALVFDGTEYTAQESGNYSFIYQVTYNISNYTAFCYSTTINRIVTVTNKVERYNSANVLQETLTYTDAVRYTTGTFIANFSPNFSMATGDYIKASSSFTSEPLISTLSSACTVEMNLVAGALVFFQATSTPAYTGEIIQSESNEYLCNIVEFSYPIQDANYNTLKNNIFNSIQYNIDGTSNKKAWIKRVTRTLATSDTQWELISNINNSQ